METDNAMTAKDWRATDIGSADTITLQLSEEDMEAMERGRKYKTSRVEYIRQLIRAAASEPIDPKYVLEIEADNDRLTRENAELQDKLHAAQVKASLTAQDDEKLRRDLTDAQAERDELKARLRYSELAAARAKAAEDAFKMCLVSARLIPPARRED